MERMKSILLLTAAVAFAVSPFVNPGFFGFRDDQLPIPQSDAPIQPAGYAFIIWSVIYLLLVIGSGYGLFKRADDPAWAPYRWPLLASLVVGAAWIPVALNSAIWALILIWVMFVTALWALLKTPQVDRFWLRTPIALYVGWLTAASCVTLALLLAGYGFLGSTPAALICLVLGLIMAGTISQLRPDTPEYTGAVIWALVGVAVANVSPLNAPVLGLCIAGIGVLGFSIFRGRRKAAST